MTAEARKRQRYTVAVHPHAIAAPDGARRPTPADAGALARLMLAAYRGTIDDEGEDLTAAEHEIARLWSGSYGPLLIDCSHVVERAGALVSASLICLWRERPLLAFAITDPAAQRAGLARTLVAMSAGDLAAAGYRELDMVITVGNRPMERVLATLGPARSAG